MLAAVAVPAAAELLLLLEVGALLAAVLSLPLLPALGLLVSSGMSLSAWICAKDHHSWSRGCSLGPHAAAEAAAAAPLTLLLLLELLAGLLPGATVGLSESRQR